MKRKLKFLPLFFAISLPAWNIYFHSQSRFEPNVSINALVSTDKMNASKVKLWIKKSEYILRLYIDGKLIKTYPVVLGPDPVNDKTHQGDGCTPEGVYKIKAKYPHRSWSYFIWIDYPNEAAWKRFNENKKNGIIEKNANIGGDVGIHGVPFETAAFGTKQNPKTPHADYLIDNKTNWTLGCISLKTADITELYQSVPIGSEVEIVK